MAAGEHNAELLCGGQSRGTRVDGFFSLRATPDGLASYVLLTGRLDLPAALWEYHLNQV
jgi:hypothetical protein